MLQDESFTREGYLSHMDNSSINDHIEWLRRVTGSADTIKHRRDNLRRLARQIKPVELIHATAADLDKWQSNLRVSRSAIMTYTCHTRAFYRWLKETGRRDDDPSASLPIPQLPKRLPRPIPEKHLELAFQCASHTMTVWLALAGWCGLRAGEIARLRGDSVIDEPTGMLLRIEGKGGKERMVPVPDEVATLLRQVIVRGPLFRSPTGKKASPNYVSSTASEFFRQLGQPYVLHQLRHRFGTEHYRLCKDIRITQELMGHSSPATTAQYIAVSQARTTKSMRRLGKTLPKPKRPRE